MAVNWHPKSGDMVIHRIRLSPPRLRQIPIIPHLYSAAYGNVGSSNYYSLGLVAMVAMGATLIVLLLPCIILILTTFTYAEGTDLFPESNEC